MAAATMVFSLRRATANFVPFRLIGVRKYTILFFGSDRFAVPFLKLLDSQQKIGNAAVQHIEVVVPQNVRMGRGRKFVRVAEVKTCANELGIRVHEAPPRNVSMTQFEVPKPAIGGEFDLGVVVSFPYFITPNVLQSLKKGAINLHPSLLPKYRGASPIQYTIMNGDKNTAITVINVSPDAFDVGDILAQQKMDVPPDSSFHSLSQLLASQGSPMLLETIENYDEKMKHRQPQSSEGASSAPKIQSSMATISFLSQTADEILRRYNAISHQYKINFFIENKRVLLFDIARPAHLPQSQVITDMQPGQCTLLHYKQSLLVRCKEGYIIVNSLQVEPKKPFSPHEFINMCFRGLQPPFALEKTQ